MPDVMQNLRQKYPEYNDIPDAELARKVVEKYPEYKEDFAKYLDTGGAAAPATANHDLTGTVPPVIPQRQASAPKSSQTSGFYQDFLDRKAAAQGSSMAAGAAQGADAGDSPNSGFYQDYLDRKAAAKAKSEPRSNISPLALRTAQGKLATTTIGPPHATPPPNPLQQFGAAAGAVLGYPQGLVNAAALPVHQSLNSRAGQLPPTPAGAQRDQASVDALMKMNPFQRAVALTGQNPLDPLMGRPAAQSVRDTATGAQFGALGSAMKQGTQIATDPVTYVFGPAGKLLPSAARKGVMAAFTAQMSADAAAKLQQAAQGNREAAGEAAILVAMSIFGAKHGIGEIKEGMAAAELRKQIAIRASEGNPVSPLAVARLASRFNVPIADITPKGQKPGLSDTAANMDEALRKVDQAQPVPQAVFPKKAQTAIAAGVQGAESGAVTEQPAVIPPSPEAAAEIARRAQARRPQAQPMTQPPVSPAEAPKSEVPPQVPVEPPKPTEANVVPLEATPKASAVRVAEGKAFAPDGKGGETAIDLPKNPKERTAMIRSIQAEVDRTGTYKEEEPAKEPAYTPPVMPPDMPKYLHPHERPLGGIPTERLDQEASGLDPSSPEHGSLLQEIVTELIQREVEKPYLDKLGVQGKVMGAYGKLGMIAGEGPLSERVAKLRQGEPNGNTTSKTGTATVPETAASERTQATAGTVEPDSKAAPKATAAEGNAPDAQVGFADWVAKQPQDKTTYTSAKSLYDAWKKENPGITKAAFGQMLHDLPRDQYEPTSTTAAAGFNAVDSTGTPRKFNGVRRVALAAEAKPKDAAVLDKGPQELSSGVPIGPVVKKILGSDRAEGWAESLTKLKDGLRGLVNPTGFGNGSQVEARAGRDYLAQEARSAYNRQRAMKPMIDHFDRLPAGAGVKFMANIERDNVHADPQTQAAGSAIRDALDRKRDQFNDVTGKLDSYIENYFPHEWKQPSKASAMFGEGRRPMEGRKGFLKKRSIPTMEEGMFPKGAPAGLEKMTEEQIREEIKNQDGLQPLTLNPIEMAQLRLGQMDKAIYAQEWFQEMKAEGRAVYLSIGKPMPEGWGKIDDKIANVREYRPTEKADGSEGAPEVIERGSWIVPDGAARIVNNYLSPGISGHETAGPAFRAISAVNNALNMAQLGLSGFHASTIALESITNQNARALRQVQAGRPVKAIGTMLTSPVAWATDFYRGSKVLNEYRNAGTMSGDIPVIVGSLIKGGGRVDLAKEFRLNAMESFGKAMKKGDKAGVALSSLPAAMETTMYPLMQQAIPRMKLGAFAEMMRDEMETATKGGKTLTEDQHREIAAKAWDSIDNRFGQLNYDNLFWDKAFKEAGHLAIRSLGWNLGTWREIGGSVVDVANTRQRLGAGGELVTPRMAYSTALVFTTAIAGAIYGYLHGHPPETLEDYFHPKNHKGERVSLPTYMKDISHYGSDPVGTAANKLSPLITVTRETLWNKDFYDKPVRGAPGKDNPQTQVAEWLRYVAKQAIPFSVKPKKEDSVLGTLKRTFTTQEGAEQALGVTPYHATGSRSNKTAAEPMSAYERRQAAHERARNK